MTLASLSGTHALLGEQATVANVRAAVRTSSIAHIAAHGVLDERNLFRSHLVLADGDLESWQLFQDARNAALLVFSACDLRRAPDSL
jgi:CHAT domain-containing protein